MKAPNKRTRTLTVRFDLDKERDLTVWEHLHNKSERRYSTCNTAVIEDLAEYIRTRSDTEKLTDILSESIRTAIRDEFVRILSNSGNINAHAPYVKHDTSTTAVQDLIDDDFMGG